MIVARVLLVVLATARLVRFVTRDKLPEHLVIRHVRARAKVADDSRPANLAAYVTEALDCPHCSGFWIAGAVVVLEGASARAPRRLRALWSGILAALALNYVTAHISHRIDH